jgi:hypothetical protein
MLFPGRHSFIFDAGRAATTPCHGWRNERRRSRQGGSKFFVLDVYRTRLPRDFDPSIHDATNFDRGAETEEVLNLRC